MRDHFYKFMPWVLGSVLGWMLWHPPVWLQSLGMLAYVVNLGLIGLVLLSMAALVIVANLPRRLETTPVNQDAVHPELGAAGERIERLGFRPAGPPLRVKIAPSAILLGYVHETEPVYATAFRTETLPEKLGCDFVSILHGDRGGLTTNADPGGAALPAGDGGLRQVFPGAPVEQLLSEHLEGIAYLRERGIHCRPVSADTLPQDLSTSIGRQRELFAASPLRSTLITVWRSATKRVPFVGSLREQPVAQTQIGRLLVS